MTENKELALLVGVDLSDGEDFNQSMSELEDLASACNMETVCVMTQKLAALSQTYYIGSGKVDELKEFVQNMDVDIVIFDRTLTPAQLRNLSSRIAKPILDRTGLILEIFAVRARTREARLQVESARLKYLLPRLVGMHDALSRQGGGSGLANKGAGETKLELDRRRIEHRLTLLRRELDELSKERQTQKKQRLQGDIPRVALVGYTNAGKSTLMNGMLEHYGAEEDKKVFEEDMLFATLETTVRRIQVTKSERMLLSDTVGFIRQLPHGLIKAFHSTLEEVREANLLLHVIDYSDKDYRLQREVTQKTLEELGAGEIPVIYVYNKADLCMEEKLPVIKGTDRIYMSAKCGQGLEELVSLIFTNLHGADVLAEYLFPYGKGQAVAYLMEHAKVLSCEYEQDGVRMNCRLGQSDAGRYEAYLVSKK